MGYCNPEVDKLLDEARVPSDLPARKAIYEKLTKIILADVPKIYLYHRRILIAHTNKLSGYKQMPDGLVRVVAVSLKSPVLSCEREKCSRHAKPPRQTAVADRADLVFCVGDHLLAATAAAGRSGFDHGRRRTRSGRDRADSAP